MDTGYIPFAEAARRCPSWTRPDGTEGGVHPSAVWRWARKGLVGRSGRRVRLRHVRVGKRVYTTAAWLEQFFRQLAEADLGHFRDNADDPGAFSKADEELDSMRL